jgi:hypothetical protein
MDDGLNHQYIDGYLKGLRHGAKIARGDGMRMVNSDTMAEGIEKFAQAVDDILNMPEEVLKNEDGSVKSFMIKLPGKEQSFRCDNTGAHGEKCGCNCFHKMVGDPDRFICNGCDAEYISGE